MAGEIYQSVFTKDQLFKATTVPVLQGEIVRLGQYKVQAGERVSLGSGMLAGMDNATGRVFMQFKDTTATPVLVPGRIRISAWSSQNRYLATIKEWRTEQLDSSLTDLTKQLPFPEHGGWANEDQLIVIEFIADANATISKANSTIMLPVTVQAL